MEKFISNFNTTSELEAFMQTDEFKTPHVSLTNDNGKMHYFEYDYSQDYFTTIANGDGEISLKIESAVYTSELSYISYSKDNGETWVRTDNRNYATINITVDVNEGDKVLWKGSGRRLTSGYQSPSGSTFLATTDFTVEGNIMSLLSGDTEFKNAELAVSGGSSLMPVTYDYHFARLFSGNTHIIDAENLVFAVNAPLYCYSDMFRNCINLEKAPKVLRAEGKTLGYSAMFWGCSKIKKAPEIKANELMGGDNMFNGCTSLIKVPGIKATAFGGCANMFANCTSLVVAPKMNPLTIASWGFNGAFRGCTSLKVPPQLPATAVTNNCYSFMFSGCTSLTIAPQLPATTLAESCYSSMFKGCTRLITAPQLSATTLANSCYQSMFEDCTSLTTAPELPATTLAVGCYYSMFKGCTHLTTAPQLLATTVADNCYYSMFSNCTRLTTAPELPATTLANYCYNNMFYGCTNLSSIKCLATDISATNCTYDWVNGVAASGTFTKAASMSSWTSGSSGIPTNWTVVDAT